MIKMKIFPLTGFVAGIQQGEFPEEQTLKCYALCIMKSMRTVMEKAFIFVSRYGQYKIFRHFFINIAHEKYVENNI